MTADTWLLEESRRGDLSAIAHHVRGVIIAKAATETEAGVGGVADAPWFVEKHLKVVEARMAWVLENCEGAKDVDPDEASIAVWTHDLGRIMGFNASHHGVSALQTRQWLLANGLDGETAGRIYKAALRHRASGEFMPETPLEMAIATADALSHFDGCEGGDIEIFMDTQGFWYQLWKEKILGEATNEEILERSLKKMERDAGSKQSFPEARARAQREFEFLSTNAETILNLMREELQGS